MAQLTSQPNSTLLQVWFSKVIEPELAKMNIVRRKQLDEVPRNFGNKVFYRKNLRDGWVLPIKGISYIMTVNNDLILAGGSWMEEVKQQVADAARKFRLEYGQHRRSRNYYLAQFTQVYVSQSPITLKAQVTWKMWYALEPKSFGKVQYKAKQSARAKGRLPK